MTVTRRGFLETTPTETSYPLRIRFWYIVHNHAERLWHWVWRAKLSPWHEADRRSRLAEVPATDTPERVEVRPGVFVVSPAKDSGVTSHRIYIGRRIGDRIDHHVVCGRCAGNRFLCEQHPTRPWPHDDCAGPGVPCPECNTGARPDLPKGFETIATTRRGVESAAMATPDLDHDAGFRSMALSILDAVPLDQHLSDADHSRLYETTITALKMTWNARGAADLTKLELPASKIHDAIRALDL